MQSDLGLTPNNDGKVIRLAVPQLTAVSVHVLQGQELWCCSSRGRQQSPAAAALLWLASRWKGTAPTPLPCPAPTLPPHPQERRKEMTKTVSKLGEEGKVALRNVRRDAMKAIEKLEKDGSISGGRGAAGAVAVVRGCCGGPKQGVVEQPPRRWAAPATGLHAAPAPPPRQRTSARGWRTPCRS